MKLKQQLKQWRKAKKLSQSATARKLTKLINFPSFSISTRSIENWEQGVREPNPFLLALIERALQ